MALTNLLVPTFTQMLNALAAWLAKAQAQMPDDAEKLLSARLAPDMFPLSTQIRFGCMQVHEAIYRLKGEAFPAAYHDLVAEGRNAGEHPGTIAEAQARIDEAKTLLESLSPGELEGDGDDNRAIAHEIPNGMIFDLTAEQYVRDWVLAQFYFHLMAAYAILRKERVELGKADYFAHMFQHIRPGSMPKH